MVLVATWDDQDQLGLIEDPADMLKMPDFFASILDAVMTNTPVDVHLELRRRQLGAEPPGGLPPPQDGGAPEIDLLPTG
jgi:hypothetical protein